MKAIQVRSTGGPEVLELRALPDSVPQTGEVLIRVQTCGKVYESEVDEDALGFVAKMLVQTSSRFRSSTNFGRRLLMSATK